MIGKVLRGDNIAGLLRYLYGPGKSEEHVNPRLVAGWRGPLAELEPIVRQTKNGDSYRSYRHLTKLLKAPVEALGADGYDKYVWHCVMRAAPEDPQLSDAQWGEIAREVMHHTGLSPRGQESRAVRWVAVRHADDHIHIAATLARADGGKPRVWNDFYRVREACRMVEERYGLRMTAPGDRTAARRPTRAEMEKARRQGWAEPERVLLRRRVSAAAAGAATAEQFFHHLEASGVQVSTRMDTAVPGKACGYAVAFPRQRAGVEPVWLSGGQLAADLTLPKLQRRWGDSGPVPDRGPSVPMPVQADDTAVRRATPEPAAARMSGKAARAALRALVGEAATDADSEPAFFAALEERGVLVRLRHSQIDPDQVTSYAVSLPTWRDSFGEQVWVGGGKLEASLALPQLRRRWRARPAELEGVPVASPLSPEEARLLYEEAAAAASYAAERLRMLLVTDPHAASDVAWAAADVLHVAAQASDNPELRKAGDAFDRAARQPYGRIPPRSSAGARLRHAARLMAIANMYLHDETLAMITLVVNMGAVAVLVSELRDRQMRPAQADGARVAAAHLRKVVVTARATPTGHLGEDEWGGSSAAVGVADPPRPGPWPEERAAEVTRPPGRRHPPAAPRGPG